jgi:hypothetical protein
MRTKSTALTVLVAVLLPLGIASAGDSPSRKPAPTEIAPSDEDENDDADVDAAPNDSEGPSDTPPSGETIIDCWCEGGENGNGPARCVADECNGSSADQCCADAYGLGSAAEDPN